MKISRNEVIPFLEKSVPHCCGKNPEFSQSSGCHGFPYKASYTCTVCGYSVSASSSTSSRQAMTKATNEWSAAWLNNMQKVDWAQDRNNGR